jgi:hypothetical protein
LKLKKHKFETSNRLVNKLKIEEFGKGFHAGNGREATKKRPTISRFLEVFFDRLRKRPI